MVVWPAANTVGRRQVYRHSQGAAPPMPRGRVAAWEGPRDDASIVPYSAAVMPSRQPEPHAA